VSRKGALPSLPTLHEVTAHLQANADQVAPELLQALGKVTTACPGHGHTCTGYGHTLAESKQYLPHTPHVCLPLLHARGSADVSHLCLQGSR
jgi:hypothetical protein